MTRESYFSSSMRRVVKRATGDLHISSRRGTSVELQLKILQQQGLLPLLLESEAETPIVPNGYGLTTGTAFFPCFWGKRTGRESMAKYPNASELMREITYHIFPKAGTSATQDSPLSRRHSKEQTKKPLWLTGKTGRDSGTVYSFSVCHSAWIQHHHLDKLVNTDISSFKAVGTNAQSTWPQKECIYGTSVLLKDSSLKNCLPKTRANEKHCSGKKNPSFFLESQIWDNRRSSNSLTPELQAILFHCRGPTSMAGLGFTELSI